MITLTQNYRQPEKFWKQLKRIKAPQTITDHYLIKNNNKLTKEEEKEEAFREIWKTNLK